MTTDTMQPQVELEAAPAAGPGESKGHRRRRRRRKNKSSQVAQAQPSPQLQAQTAPPQTQSRPASQPQAKRKKKFFQKNQQTQVQPGNSINPPAHNRRKIRQKGPREFVGPMDHSYRIVNGNVADTSPSTISVNGNGGNGYSENYLPPSVPVPIREDAPTRIYCFIEDLFFLAKITEAARKLGVKVEFVKGADKDVIARMTGAAEEDRPALLVFDLNNTNAKPLTLIPKLKTKLKKATSIIGFLSHVQGDLKMKAVDAGCDTVMPRSAFSQSLPNLLRRYGVEEEEEYEPQPV
jgi:CheY-like chemotaxis protein